MFALLAGLAPAEEPADEQSPGTATHASEILESLKRDFDLDGFVVDTAELGGGDRSPFMSEGEFQAASSGYEFLKVESDLALLVARGFDRNTQLLVSPAFPYVLSTRDGLDLARYPIDPPILGETKSAPGGERYLVWNADETTYYFDIEASRDGAFTGEVMLLTGDDARAWLAENAPDDDTITTARGGTPDIAVDKTGIEIDCPSLPTNVTRSGAAATGSPVGPHDGHDHSGHDHSGHDHAVDLPANNGAIRDLSGLVTVADTASFRSAETGQPFAAEVSPDLLVELYNHHTPAIVRDVPLTGGGTADFYLEPFEVFSQNGGGVVAFDGTTETPLPEANVRLYRGDQIGNAARDMILSVTEGEELRIIVREPGVEVLSIVPDNNAARSAGAPAHIVALGATSPGGMFCSADEVLENRERLSTFQEPDPMELLRNLENGRDACFDDRVAVEVLVDVNYGLYVSTYGASTSRATNYVTNLFGFSSALYERDIETHLTIKQLVIWTAPDPFSGASSGQQLTAYRNYNRDNRSGVVRDLAHLLADEQNFGGIAYVGAICSTNTGYGVSNIFGNQNINATSYTWDVEVVSHELGHNFGSPHTHCYSPPIDCCYNEQCNCGPAVAQLGTIMSYCHLNGSIALNFHPRVIDVMTDYVQTRGCVTEYEGVPERRFVVSNEGDAPLTINSVTLDTPTPWITMCPTFPMTLEPGESVNLHIEINCPDVPPGETVRTLIVDSDDPDENPLPGGLTITVRKPFRYPITTDVEPDGAGSVSLSPTPGTDGQWEDGTDVTVRAIPVIGWEFSGWTGDVSGTSSPTLMTVDGPKSVTANFVQARYGLTVSVIPSGAGSVVVTPDPEPDQQYLVGTEIELEAFANPGYTFESWTPTSTDNPRTLIMNSDRTVIARFKEGYRLTLLQSHADAGTIRITPDPDDDIYEPDALVRLQVQPANGYTFAGWTGDQSGSSATLSFNINADTTIMANYNAPTYTFAANANPPEGGSVTLDPLPNAQGRYERNTEVTVTASPASGYGFIGWSGDTTEVASSFTMMVTSATSITAEFAPLFNPLTVNVVPDGAGTVIASPGPDSVDEYSLGIEVDLTATPNGDYTFFEWEGDASGTDSTTSVLMNGPRTVTARFRSPQYALTSTAIPLDGGTITADPAPNPDNGLYDKDTEVQLTANPALGFVFRQWSGDATGGALTTTVTVTGALSVSAEFETQSSVIVR